MVEVSSIGYVEIPAIKIVTSKSIFLNNETVTRATLNANETKVGEDSFTYFLSADGGSNWEQVSRGTEYAFQNTGTDLRFKVLGVGTGGSNTYIENLIISYKT